jgi:hypothetical protein
MYPEHPDAPESEEGLSDQLFEHINDRGLGNHAYVLRGDFAFMKHHESGNALNIVLICAPGTFIHIQFGYLDATPVFLSNLLYQWSEHAAGNAPFGPEINQDRNLGLENFTVKNLV